MSSRRVVVVGGGAAGLVAGATAAEEGAEVVVLDAGEAPGGSLALSRGIVSAPATYEAMRQLVPSGDPAVQRLVQDRLRTDLGWLGAAGVEVTECGPMMGAYHAWTVPVEDWVGQLVAKLLDHGGQLRLATRMTDLSHLHEATLAVRVAGPSGDETIHADAVVLATGGFQGSRAVMRRLGIPNSDHVYIRSNSHSDGTAVEVGLRQGARLSPGLDTFYGHAMPVLTRIGEEQFAGMAQYYGNHAVAINLHGRRFTDESLGGFEENVNLELAHQPSAQGFYVVGSKTLAVNAIDGLPWTVGEIIDRAESAGAVVLRAASLRELCAELSGHGVDGAAALATLTEYDEAVASRTADRLEPGRARHQHRLASALVAVWVRASVTFTSGGIAVGPDLVCQTQAEDGSGVPFYVAGADVGGASIRGYLGGLATALTTGRQAGLNAARGVRGEDSAIDGQLSGHAG